MKQNHYLQLTVLALATLIAVLMPTGTASAAEHGYRTIYRFKGGNDGRDPGGPPAIDKNGNLFGITLFGGTDNIGTLYELAAPRTRLGSWKETVLYEFPAGSWGAEFIAFGPDGNLYGFNGQTIFEFKRQNLRRDGWKYLPLYTLNGNTDGYNMAGLGFDPDGNLYGTAADGGDLGCHNGWGCGTVFELRRPNTKSGKWHFTVLYTFTGQPDGDTPIAGVTFSRRGNMFGPTWYGGIYGYGTVYRLVRPAKKGAPWTEGVLYSFGANYHGIAVPLGPVTFDEKRRQNVYGTAAIGGGNDCGGVFELSPPAKKGGDWPYAPLYTFTGEKDGCYGGGFGDGNMVIDRSGNLYGTTPGGGDAQGGTVFRLSPPANGSWPWTETTLHSFTGKNGDGGVPYGVTWGKWGDLYGLTGEGGHCLGCGTVYEVRP